ncbi:MAG TPA: AAA family ATPase [Candidatus Binatia bacterium]
MIQPSAEAQKSVESHFGFQEPPFGVTPNPRFYYINTAYSDALAEVAHGIVARKGLMLVTGEVGTGKTILLRKLMNDLGATVKFVFISSSQLTPNGFGEMVSASLGLTKKKTRVEMTQDLTKYLLQRAVDGQIVALLVDEAQNTNESGFEALCGLSNLETDDQKLLQIVLVGQPELLSKLDNSSLRQIKQRVAIQHTVTGLETKTELEQYIHHRLHVVGYNGPEIFTQEALDTLWEYTGGIPRLVNILCDNSLALAFGGGIKNVSGEIVRKAADKFRLNRTAQHPVLADAEIAAGGVTEVRPTAEANEITIGNANGVHRPVISPHLPEPRFIGSPHSSPSSEVSLSVEGEAAQLPVDDEQVDNRSETQSSRDENFRGASGVSGGIRKNQSRKRWGLRWKIAGAFSTVTLILSAVLIGTVYHLAEETLRAQVDKRALAVAQNLSDASAGYMLSNDLLALNTLLRKYTYDDGLAYAFIRDSGGAITAHTLETLSSELHQRLPGPRQRVPWRREFSLQGKLVYETSVPILDGQLGMVHVGFWGDAVKKEIRWAILPMIAAIGIIPVVGVALSFVLAHMLAAPIIRLRRVAEEIIEGDLESCGTYSKSYPEVDDLARSLERMRASLRAAMSRLRRDLG